MSDEGPHEGDQVAVPRGIPLDVSPGTGATRGDCLLGGPAESGGAATPPGAS